MDREDTTKSGHRSSTKLRWIRRGQIREIVLDRSAHMFRIRGHECSWDKSNWKRRQSLKRMEHGRITIGPGVINHIVFFVRRVGEDGRFLGTRCKKRTFCIRILLRDTCTYIVCTLLTGSFLPFSPPSSFCFTVFPPPQPHSVSKRTDSA